MKTCRTLVAVGLVAALATPTFAQEVGTVFVPSDGVVNAVVAQSGSQTGVIQPAGFVLMRDSNLHRMVEPGCGPHYSGCETFGDPGCCTTDCCIESCCGNKWQFRAGWINMKRVSEDVVLVRDITTGGTAVEALNADDFDYNFESGFDLGVLYGFDDCNWIEFRYLWLDDATDTQAVSALTATNSILVTNPPTALGGGSVTATNKSEFQTAEVNFRSRRGLGRVTLIGGFRYAQLDENLQITPTVVPATNWDTENDLYGLQIGADVALIRVAGDKFRIDGLVKGGVYYNDVRSTINSGAQQIGRTDDAVAFLGEFGLFAHWEATCHLAFRAGYQCIWFNGVATGEGQVNGTGSLTATPLAGAVDTESNAIFHGVNLMVIGSF